MMVSSSLVDWISSLDVSNSSFKLCISSLPLWSSSLALCSSSLVASMSSVMERISSRVCVSSFSNCSMRLWASSPNEDFFSCSKTGITFSSKRIKKCGSTVSDNGITRMVTKDGLPWISIGIFSLTTVSLLIFALCKAFRNSKPNPSRAIFKRLKEGVPCGCIRNGVMIPWM